VEKSTIFGWVGKRNGKRDAGATMVLELDCERGKMVKEKSQ